MDDGWRVFINGINGPLSPWRGPRGASLDSLRYVRSLGLRTTWSAALANLPARLLGD